jgi:hypothetical protein
MFILKKLYASNGRTQFCSGVLHKVNIGREKCAQIPLYVIENEEKTSV